MELGGVDFGDFVVVFCGPFAGEFHEGVVFLLACAVGDDVDDFGGFDFEEVDVEPAFGVEGVAGEEVHAVGALGGSGWRRRRLSPFSVMK